MAVLESHEDSLVGVFGGRGTGKSYLVKRLIKGVRRLLVWDLMGEYPGHPIDGDLQELLRWVRRSRFRVAFRPRFDAVSEQFATVCRIAMAVGDLTFVVEELNRVTTAQKSPAAWQNVTSRGRHRGLKIIGVSQRPAGVDKDFISNMTECYAGRMTYDKDWQALQMIMGAEARRIPTLKSHKQLHWKA